jgi:predicted nucleic acid-binding protein
VKYFFDTSALIPVFMEDHQHHEPSLAAFAAADKKRGSCAAHSLAELYSVFTRLPGRHRLSPEQVLLFVEEIEERLTLISLDGREYSASLRDAVAAGIAGGILYDALLARCARKANAEVIYTWNLDHFRRLGPELAKRVKTP